MKSRLPTVKIPTEVSHEDGSQTSGVAAQVAGGVVQDTDGRGIVVGGHRKL